MRTRTVLLVNTITPFRAACYAALAREPGIDLEVWITGGRALTRPAMVARLNALPFRCQLLPAVVIQRETDRATCINPDLLFRLQAAAPQVVISSELSLPSFVAALYAQLWGRRLVLWGGGTVRSEGGISRLKALWRRWLVEQADSFVAYGTASARYWQSLGAPRASISIAYNTVDVDWWRGQAARTRPDRDHIRRELGAREFVALYVGQLIPRKRPHLLLELAELCQRRGLAIDFVLVGEGSERDALARSIARSGLRNVRLLPFQQPEDLVSYYIAADAFLLPSSDIWGLVVNEAMACGVAPIISPQVECAEDLVLPGVNGFVIDYENLAAVVHVLETALGDRAVWRAVGQAAARSVARFTPELWSAGFVQAIGASPTALPLAKKKPNGADSLPEGSAE